MKTEKKDILITGGRVIDPVRQFDQKADILISDGRIARIGTNLKKQKVKRVQKHHW